MILFVSSIAERSRVARKAAPEPDLSPPEPPPAPLARPAARPLGLAPPGLSVPAGEGGRAPLGASTPTADLAERLQFTAGDGPCETAQRHQEPVLDRKSVV